jgi:hypothetical protein
MPNSLSRDFSNQIKLPVQMKKTWMELLMAYTLNGTKLNKQIHFLHGYVAEVQVRYEPRQ